MFSSEYIDNGVITLTYEPTSYEYHFETTFQVKISPCDKTF